MYVIFLEWSHTFASELGTSHCETSQGERGRSGNFGGKAYAGMWPTSPHTVCATILCSVVRRCNRYINNMGSNQYRRKEEGDEDTKDLKERKNKLYSLSSLMGHGLVVLQGGHLWACHKPFCWSGGQGFCFLHHLTLHTFGFVDSPQTNSLYTSQFLFSIVPKNL